MTNKASKTIDEQITLLKQRGMLFRSEEYARGILAHISYYRLKGYWWDCQSDKVAHIFNSGTCFEDIVHRYNFDRELRLILFDAIEVIEIALRTKMVYHLSQAHGGLWYLNETLFEDNNLYIQQLSDLKSEFIRSGEIFAKDFKHKHSFEEDDHIKLNAEPDAWLIFEVATFGTLSKIYKNLCHQMPQKSLIANEFGLNLHSELSSWLEAISYLRNIVAHHSRVWSRNMVRRPCDISKSRLTWLKHNLKDVQKKKPFLVISAMLYLCNAIDSNNRFKENILELFNQNPGIPIYKLGFMNNWDEEPLWTR